MKVKTFLKIMFIGFWIDLSLAILAIGLAVLLEEPAQYLIAGLIALAGVLCCFLGLTRLEKHLNKTGEIDG